MKSTATQMKESSRKSAEWTGLRMEMTSTDDATAIVPIAKKTRKGMLLVSWSIDPPERQKAEGRFEGRRQKAEGRSDPRIRLLLLPALCLAADSHLHRER